ncbi:MAG: cohesin domain-containing protein [Candidatus Peregrinibacteria bacterium]|nr:cohesin domain-containing protein [Candidatus Peregrinibacteria bacterium]
MIKNVFKICGVVVVFALFSSTVFAVNVQITAAKKEFTIGDQFQVDFKVDAQGENINAMEGTLDFSSDLFSVVKINDGNSIVGKWIEKPAVSSAAVKFSYIIPNGYKGILSPYYSGYKPGKMFSVVFSAKKKGSGYIKISKGEVYLNDANAKKTKFSSSALYVNVLDVGDSKEAVLPKKMPNSMDVLPPDKFVVLLSSDESIFEGKWFLAFDAKDNGDGVDHYEVYESRSKGYAEDGWVRAESPYVLEDQNLSGYVYVKAVDENGNAQVETFSPLGVLPWYNYFSFWIAIVLGGGVVVFALTKKK